MNILRSYMVPTWQWWLLINWMSTMLALWFCILAIWVVLTADQGLGTNMLPSRRLVDDDRAESTPRS